jgi:hypothetical protein
MNQPQEYTNNNGGGYCSIKGLRKEMAHLLVLREQVREAEAGRNKRFLIVEGNHRSKPNSMQPSNLIAPERLSAAGKR